MYGRDTEHDVRLCEQRGRVHPFGPEDVRFTPHPLMHNEGQDNALAVLFVGASMVLLDSWSGERGLQVLTKAAPPRSWPRRASSTT